MPEVSSKTTERIGFTMVLLMVLLQAVYAVYAYCDPQAFASLRGTELFLAGDADWIRIYASRTLFVALISGCLLFFREYKILIWVCLFGTVMPITDALLAIQANAESVVVYKHIATALYLLATLLILKRVVKGEANTEQN